MYERDIAIVKALKAGLAGSETKDSKTMMLNYGRESTIMGSGFLRV